MTATNHGLFGSSIAITLHNYPVVAILVAIASHFLLDSLPHYGDDAMSLHDKKFYKILGSDMFLAVVTTLVVATAWHQYFFLVIICAFAAASPDLMWIYYEYINKPLKKRHLVPRFHSWIQWSQTPNGAFIELTWFICFFVGLSYFGAA